MRFLNDWRKYFIVLAILILVGFALFFRYALSEWENTLVREQAFEKRQDVGLLGQMVDTLVEMDKQAGREDGYEDVLQGAVQYIESNYNSTFAQVFDDQLQPLTALSPGVAGGRKHNPLDYPEFVDAVKTSGYGSLTYWYETPQAGGRTVYMTFRWVPTDCSYTTRYLIAVGISKYTIVESISSLVKYGLLALIIVMAFYVIGFTVLVVLLGDIYERREGDKWRKEGG